MREEEDRRPYAHDGQARERKGGGGRVGAACLLGGKCGTALRGRQRGGLAQVREAVRELVKFEQGVFCACGCGRLKYGNARLLKLSAAPRSLCTTLATTLTQSPRAFGHRRRLLAVHRCGCTSHALRALCARLVGACFGTFARVRSLRDDAPDHRVASRTDPVPDVDSTSSHSTQV